MFIIVVVAVTCLLKFFLTNQDQTEVKKFLCFYIWQWHHFLNVSTRPIFRKWNYNSLTIKMNCHFHMIRAHNMHQNRHFVSKQSLLQDWRCEKQIALYGIKPATLRSMTASNYSGLVFLAVAVPGCSGWVVYAQVVEVTIEVVWVEPDQHLFSICPMDMA